MSRIWQDGFDVYAVTADLSFRYNYQNVNVGLTTGRWNGGGIEIQNNSNLVAPFVSLPSEVWVGFSFKGNTVPGNVAPLYIASFISANGFETCITYNPVTMIFQAYEAATTTVIGSSSTPIILTLGVWHYIDIHFKLDGATSGIVEIWIDDTRIMNLTGVKTAWSSGTTLTGMSIGMGAGAYNRFAMFIDDWCVNDVSGSFNNGRIGDSRITTTVPNSDASPNNGTPTSGTDHFAMVDEPQWSSADTLTLVNTAGQEEKFGMSALTITPVDIFAVQVITVCEKTDGGTGFAKLGVTSSGVLELGASQTLNTNYNILNSIFEKDPNGVIPWTEITVNAVKINFTVQ